MAEKGGETTADRRRQLVLVPCPLQGHINPMLQLATILQSQGFSILIALCHPLFDFPNISNHPHFTFHPLVDTKLEIFYDIIATLSNFEQKCKDPLENLLTRVCNEEESRGRRRPCVIYDGLMYFAEAVADKLKLSSFVLQTSSVAFTHSFSAYPGLREKGCLPAHESRLLELVPGFHPLRFKDLYISPFRSLDDLMELLDKITNPGSSSGLIWNTMNFLDNTLLSELQRQCQVPMFPIGPMHKMAPSPSFSLEEEDKDCITWLDKQANNSVIYVSFGSLAFVKEKELVEMAWGLANSEQPFLLVFRPDSVHGSRTYGDLLFLDDCLRSVGERGCIVKWAPQKEVLAHNAVGGYWSHCGWNSIVESISEGVPMICRPRVWDQNVNARYVSHVWGVGFELEGDLEREYVKRAVTRLMVEEEGEVLRRKAANLKTNAELSVGEDGSSWSSLENLVELLS